MNVRTFLIALAASTALVGAAHAADPIKVGLSGPYTGGSSSMGVSMRDGAKLAADEINKAGGVMGRPLQLVERDDESPRSSSTRKASSPPSASSTPASPRPRSASMKKPKFRC